MVQLGRTPVNRVGRLPHGREAPQNVDLEL